MTVVDARTTVQLARARAVIDGLPVPAATRPPAVPGTGAASLLEVVTLLEVVEAAGERLARLLAPLSGPDVPAGRAAGRAAVLR